MTADAQFQGVVQGVLNEGVPVLTIDYRPETMLMLGAYEQLSKVLLANYEQLLVGGPDDDKKPPSCIVIIKAETAGSPLVRALFDLYKGVVARGGQIIIVNYPDDYIASLTSLGLTDLTGFSLSRTEQDALQELTSGQ